MRSFRATQTGAALPAELDKIRQTLGDAAADSLARSREKAIKAMEEAD